MPTFTIPSITKDEHSKMQFFPKLVLKFSKKNFFSELTFDFLIFLSRNMQNITPPPITQK